MLKVFKNIHPLDFVSITMKIRKNNRNHLCCLWEFNSRQLDSGLLLFEDDSPFTPKASSVLWEQAIDHSRKHLGSDLGVFPTPTKKKNHSLEHSNIHILKMKERLIKRGLTGALYVHLDQPSFKTDVFLLIPLQLGLDLQGPVCVRSHLVQNCTSHCYWVLFEY